MRKIIPLIMILRILTAPLLSPPTPPQTDTPILPWKTDYHNIIRDWIEENPDFWPPNSFTLLDYCGAGTPQLLQYIGGASLDYYQLWFVEHGELKTVQTMEEGRYRDQHQGLYIHLETGELRIKSYYSSDTYSICRLFRPTETPEYWELSGRLTRFGIEQRDNYANAPAYPGDPEGTDRHVYTDEGGEQHAVSREEYEERIQHFFDEYDSAPATTYSTLRINDYSGWTPETAHAVQEFLDAWDSAAPASSAGTHPTIALL